MSDSAIRAAIEDILVTWNGDPVRLPVAWDALAYTPTPNQQFLSPRFISWFATGAAVGRGRAKQISGQYQISVYWPNGRGVDDAMKLADELIALYFDGRTVTATTGEVIHFEVAYPKPPLEDPAWLHIPVLIPWFTYA